MTPYVSRVIRED